MPIHLLFDLDDTPIDSAPSMLASMSAALMKCGITPIIPLDKSLIGPPLRDTLQRVTGIDNAERIESLVNAFKTHYDTDGYRETMVYPGIGAALKFAATRHLNRPEEIASLGTIA
ncbi:MAG: HAD hydrolase-like protein [Sulfurisoma sp.]|nr:HAD hydrolase-like protein [Sulfurisoma sp.]